MSPDPVEFRAAVSSRMRVLVLCEGTPGTGYRRIAEGLVAHLREGADITVATLQSLAQRGGDLTMEAPGTALAMLVEETHVDVLIVNFDIGVVARLAAGLRALAGRVRRILYAPLDGPTVDPGFAASLEVFDVVVTYTVEQALRIERALRAIESDQHRAGSVHLASVAPAPVHRFSEDAFTRNNEVRHRRSAARRVLLGHDADSCDFIVLNGNKNVWRKRIDLTIRAFALFADGKPPGVKLMLHMRWDAPGGWAIRDLVRVNGIESRVIAMDGVDAGRIVDDTDLCHVYGAADIGVNTSYGEGWGLVAMEHACYRAPQILPDQPTLRSIWGDSALFARTWRPFSTHTASLEEGEVDVVAVAAHLESVYRDRSLLAQWGQKARSRAEGLGVDIETGASSWWAILEQR